MDNDLVTTVSRVATTAIFVVAGAGWLLAVVSAFARLRHRAPDKSVAWFLFRGYAFFTRDGFTESARPAHTRFLAGVALFGVALIGIVVQAAAFG